MNHKVADLAKSSVTDVTAVRRFPGVRAPMPLQCVTVTKGLVTLGAGVGLVARMNAFVPFEIAAAAKGLATHVAAVGSVADVSAEVSVQSAVVTKASATHETREWFITGVNTPMSLQIGSGSQGLVTYVAVVCTPNLCFGGVWIAKGGVTLMARFMSKVNTLVYNKIASPRKGSVTRLTDVRLVATLS